MDWFTVDRAGLAKIIDRKGKAFAIFELVQNAWDTDAGTVRVTVAPVPGRPLAVVTVEDDDPEGFKNLAHAFTLFAESEKKGDPTKRGRFNLGEKLVLALCETASIRSTKGTVVFDADGRRETRQRRERGSVFEGMLRMTREEMAEVAAGMRRLIRPVGVSTIFNEEPLPLRPPIAAFEAALPTEISDAEGYLRRSSRKTLVTVHEVALDEPPMLYEMGIPVVELTGGERWHVNVHQKIPLALDRENVTPAYLQTLRVLLANAMLRDLTKEDATQVWLGAATEDERVDSAAVEKVLDHRFGKKRAVFDPSDPEANKQLMNEGYTVIPGGALSRGQWENVRSAGLAAPAGQVRPSGVHYSPEGRPERVISPETYTFAQQRLVAFTRTLAKALGISDYLGVKIVNEPIALPHAAWYGDKTIAFNLGRLGKAWFEQPLGPVHMELILHELAHDKIGDHLTHQFADEVARLAVQVVRIALHEPKLLRAHEYDLGVLT